MHIVTACVCRVLVDSSASTGAGVRAVARRSYAARGGQELSLGAGQLVHLARRLDYHWYLARTTSVSGGGGEQVDSGKYFYLHRYTSVGWSGPRRLPGHSPRGRGGQPRHGAGLGRQGGGGGEVIT